MKKVLRNNGLTIAVLVFFVLFLIGMTASGLRDYNNEQLSHSGVAVSWTQYVQTGAFGEAVFENWESEFFQMFSYVMLTAFLYQLGSPESKSVNKHEEVDEDPLQHRQSPGAPRIVRYGSTAAVKLYSHSLGIAFLCMWLITVFLHMWTGSHAYNEEQAAHGAQAVSLLGYFTTSTFWFESMQNYQSEFMVIAVLIVAGIYLRERGSPESKPVHGPHQELR